MSAPRCALAHPPASSCPLQALNDMHVLLEGTLLKPNMVTGGEWGTRSPAS